MAKLLSGRSACPAGIVQFSADFPLMEASRARNDLFSRFFFEGLRYCLNGIRAVFRHGFVFRRAFFTDRIGNPQEIEAIRNRAYLDIHRIIR
jgi:hypothetical protein